MQFDHYNTTRDDKGNVYFNVSLSAVKPTNTLTELNHVKAAFDSFEEVSIVPKSTFDILVRFGPDLIKFIDENYPENTLSESSLKFAKFIKAIH